MITETARFLVKEASSGASGIFGSMFHHPAVFANYVGNKGLQLANLAGRAGAYAIKRPLRSAAALAALGYYGWLTPRRLEKARNNINPSKEFQV